MKSIYLLSFILVLASASPGFDLSLYQYPPVGLYPCIANLNANLTTLELVDVVGNINSKTFLLNYIASRDAKIKNVDAIVRVNDSLVPEDLCNGVAGGLPARFSGNVWLSIQNYQTLWSLPIDQRISYVENLTKACQNHGLKIGIASSALEWHDVFGSSAVGSDVLKKVPVWYVNNNGNADFDDFDYAGFGTWDSPSLKSYSVNAYVCDKFITNFLYFEV